MMETFLHYLLISKEYGQILISDDDFSESE
jgi:hypothetical protein